MPVKPRTPKHPVAAAPVPPRTRRSEAKRQQVIAAATRVFVADGFVGASMDRIALAAGVSKPTVYRYFASKEELFDEILRGVADRAVARARPSGSSRRPGVAASILEVARDTAAVVMTDDVIALQRLATAEYARFPDLAKRFYEHGPRRAIHGIREFLRGHRDSGTLEIDDLDMAASHLWSLTLGMPHRTRLIDPDWKMTSAALDRWIVSGVEAFMKLYGKPGGDARRVGPKATPPIRRQR